MALELPDELEDVWHELRRQAEEAERVCAELKTRLEDAEREGRSLEQRRLHLGEGHTAAQVAFAQIDERRGALRSRLHQLEADLAQLDLGRLVAPAIWPQLDAGNLTPTPR